MKKSNAVTLLFTILFCCFLSGCASLLKNERMDQEVEKIIAALNEDDADQIFQSMYPDVVTREEFDASYESIRQIWKKCDEHTIKMTSMNINDNQNKSEIIRTYRVQYFVYTSEDSYTINLTYRSDNEGEGLYGFNLTPGTIPVLISGGFTTAKENSVPQWCALIFTVLSYVFITITIIDIFRKRPRLYGIWMVAAMTFFAFRIQIVPANFHAGGFVTWFAMSAFKIYSNNMRNFVFALPVGAVAYWFMRKRLLRKKSTDFLIEKMD